ncbi:MAG: hypothetical protein COA79_05595 [Planctomycetota bacterium]|nr:MAG: hypothetical protein COA79_05595 [Planctomycetota bacterium]
MNNLKSLFKLFLVLYFLSFIAIHLKAQENKSSDKDEVNLQLKWRHQFQFAGYYAAIEKGYYSEVGLKVKLIEGRSNLDFVQEVVSGRAQYGTELPSLLVSRSKGIPVVVLAVIYQHSPYVLLIRKDSGISNPTQLSGKKVFIETWRSASILAMLKNEGVLKEIDFVKHKWDYQSVLDGKVSAVPGYITNNSYFSEDKMKLLGVINPLTYGIDFYGDCLFTSEIEIIENPKRAMAFRAASLKGWEYAMNHTDDMIDIIINKYKSKSSRRNLIYESEQMKKLIFPKLVEMGHMNSGRWNHILDTYQRLNMIDNDFDLKGFTYKDYINQTPMWMDWIRPFIVIALMIGMAFILWNIQLQKSVRSKTMQLQQNQEALEFSLQSVTKSEQRLSLALSASKSIIWEWNFQTGEISFDSNYFNVLGCEPFEVDKYYDDWKKNIHVDDVSVLDEAMALNLSDSSSEMLVEFRFKTPANNWIWLLGKGKLWKNDDNEVPKKIIGILADVTERKQSEFQMIQSRKMEAVGQLAGGIAHDFNNLLAGILGLATILKKNEANDKRTIKFIDLIIQASEQAADLTSKLLTFGRKGNTTFRPVDLDEVIESGIELINRIIDKNVEINFISNADESIVMGDNSQILNVLMNLCINAAHAMNSNGEINIRTKNILIDNKNFQKSNIDVHVDKYVEIEFSDSGHGIPAEKIDKIFEPFYTTKNIGKGTGLGLSTVYAIIQDHQGTIDVQSEVDVGTTFIIRLPVVNEAQLTTDHSGIIQGTGKILLIDDEELVLSTTKEFLEDLNYQVLIASNGIEAIEIFKKSFQEIDLVLLDMIMPEMHGREVFYKLSEICSSCPVIILSGFSEPDDISELKIAGVHEFISKPFKKVELSKIIKKVISKNA